MSHSHAVPGSIAAEALDAWLRGDYRDGRRHRALDRRRMVGRCAYVAVACDVDRTTVDRWAAGHDVPTSDQRGQIEIIAGSPEHHWNMPSGEEPLGPSPARPGGVVRAAHLSRGTGNRSTK